MHLIYEDTKEEIIAVQRKAKHQPPHLHQAMELVYVIKGSLELGVGLELYHMEERYRPGFSRCDTPLSGVFRKKQ